MSDLSRLFRPEILAMPPYTPGEQPRGGKAIKLNTNESPYPPSPRVAEAIQHAITRLERYPDPIGTSFRLAAADVLGVSPDMILCGNGSDDILTILTRAFVGSDECVRLPTPSYILYRTLAELQGATFEEVGFDSHFQLSSEFYIDDRRLKLVFIPNPNSPSGTIIDHESLLRLADSLSCPIVIDEAYVDFASSDCIELIKQNPKIMITRTMSKSYALAGMRFGFLIANEEIIKTLRKVKDSYNTDSISIAAATAAISDQSWLRSNVSKILTTRARMTIALRELGFDVLDSHANFVWCTLRDRSVKPIYEQLKAEGILVRYMHYSDQVEGLRISVGTEAEIDALLVIVRSIMEHRFLA